MCVCVSIQLNFHSLTTRPFIFSFISTTTTEQQYTIMPPRPPYVNYEENNQWARTAKRICLIHDHVMDAFKIKNGLEVDVGCRATPDPPCDGVKELADDYRGRGHELELIFFINKW